MTNDCLDSFAMLVTAFQTRYSVFIREKIIEKEQASSRLIELIARFINNNLINLRFYRAKC